MTQPLIEKIKFRKEVWDLAASMTDEIIEKYELKTINRTGGSIFNTAPGIIVTPVDHHIGAIIEVADWLMRED